MRLEMRGQKSLESQFRKLLIFLPMQFWWTRNCLKLQIKWTRKTFDQNMGIDLCAKLCVCAQSSPIIHWPIEHGIHTAYSHNRNIDKILMHDCSPCLCLYVCGLMRMHSPWEWCGPESTSATWTPHDFEPNNMSNSNSHANFPNAITSSSRRCNDCILDCQTVCAATSLINVLPI